MFAIIRNAGFKILEKPPCSPDLAPSDFHVLRKLLGHLHGIRFLKATEVNKWFGAQDKTFFCVGVKAPYHSYTKCANILEDYAEK